MLKKHMVCPAWHVTLLMLIAVSGFCALGFWQIQRAHDKEGIMARHARFEGAAFQMWSYNMAALQEGQPIAIKGRWMAQTFYLDNQPLHHRQGFYVLSPLTLPNQHVLLVDRGWVAASSRALPDVPGVKGEVTLQGHVHYPSKKTWVLGDALEPKGEDRWLLQALDLKDVEKVLHHVTYPFILRVQHTTEDGLLRQWPLVAMPAQKHYAYALQWFVMAFIALILYLFLHGRSS